MLASMQNGASLISTLYFNNRLQPCRVSVKSSGSAPTQCSDTGNIGNVLDFSYNFSLGTADNGNVTSIANNRNHNRDLSYTYDQLNRIATAQSAATSGSDCWGLSFGYDIWANLLSASVSKCSVPTLSVGVTPQNKINNTGFSYDAAGNLTGDGSFSYTWDAESRMKSAAGVTYTYDGDDRRVQKSTGKLYWYGAGSDPIAETDVAGNNPVEYVFFAGKRIARRDASGNVSYYFADHLGTARVVTSATGTVLDDSDFYPFGGERVVVSSSGNTYKFTGKERDAESNLDDFGARYYSSGFGRFVSTDTPFVDQHVGDPQSWNLYAYARNNPLRYVDPTGHAVEFGPPLMNDAMPAGHETDATVGMPGSCEARSETCAAEEAERQAIYGPRQQQAQNQRGPVYQEPQNGQEAALANIVYNETSSLRPDPRSKPGQGGSAEALHDAREGIAEVAQRALDSGHPERVAPSDLNDRDRRALNAGNADAIRAHNDALGAAREALAGANHTNGDTQYRLRSPGVSRDRPINGKDTNFAYGPFINTLGRRQTIVFAP